MGWTAIVTPICERVENHAEPKVARSSRGSVTSVTLSGLGLAAYASRAFAPSTPGLPLGMRKSISLRLPNRPRFAFAAINASHLNPESTTSTSRSSHPARRAADRISSPASSASSGSSPWITYSGSILRAKWRGRSFGRISIVDGLGLLRGLQATNKLRDRIALHLAQQPLLFGVARQHLGFVERIGSAHHDLARRQPVETILVVKPESHPHQQREFAYAAAG